MDVLAAARQARYEATNLIYDDEEITHLTSDQLKEQLDVWKYLKGVDDMPQFQHLKLKEDRLAEVLRIVRRARATARVDDPGSSAVLTRPVPSVDLIPHTSAEDGPSDWLYIGSDEEMD